MKNIIKTLSIVLLSALLFGCESTSQKESAETLPPEYPPLYELAQAKGFKMGGCMNPDNLTSYYYTEMITSDFNSVTATNEMKLYSLLDWNIRSKDGMPALRFVNCDKLLQFCQANNIKVRGHVLVWDAYMTEWFFYEDYRTKKFADAETIKARMKYCIEAVINHCEEKFPGVVYCWDVVNEAVADGANEAIPGDACRVRKSRGGAKNMYYETIGRDYVKWAFKYAHDCIKENGYDIKLFYNDYNTYMAGKRNCIIKLVEEVNSKDDVINPTGEKLCDGVGMQCYVGGYGTQSGCMNAGDIVSIKETIEKFASLGYEVHITEMAVRNYDKSEYAQNQHAEFYGKLASMLSHINETANGKFTCWAIWGMCDNPSLPESDYSYKMNGPYCGMFDWRCRKKPEFYKTAEALKN
ncbi:MAG: endo-1,4-beta-xylanase [Treponema sp.]|nr:endo-1,4-beta-xylanase [Treponema sp.]